MTRKEAIRQNEQTDTLQTLGFTREEAEQLRRISITLHHWSEQECGSSNDYASYAIERDETTGKPYRVIYPHTSNKPIRTPIADRETGAIKRLKAIILRVNDERRFRRVEPGHDTVRECLPLSFYIQGDPRGAALYIIRPDDVPEGADVNAYYNRGICVY